MYVPFSYIIYGSSLEMFPGNICVSLTSVASNRSNAFEEAGVTIDVHTDVNLIRANYKIYNNNKIMNSINVTS